MLISIQDQLTEKSMSSLNCIEKSECGQRILGEAAARLSYETGVVQRESKLNGRVFAQMFVLGTLANPATTLNDLVQDAATLGVAISEAGLQQRLTDKAVMFLESLLQESLSVWSHRQGLQKELLQGFSQVNILDSTLVQVPKRLSHIFPGFGSHQSAMLKVQLSFDYLHGISTRWRWWLAAVLTKIVPCMKGMGRQVVLPCLIWATLRKVFSKSCTSRALTSFHGSQVKSICLKVRHIRLPLRYLPPFKPTPCNPNRLTSIWVRPNGFRCG